jgi:pantoate--beta-alanine ligase
MLMLNTIEEVRRWGREKRLTGKDIGFVPTMGYLHEGHLSLVRGAKQENKAVVVSIFVNPLQFGPQEDFATYPRDLTRDLSLAEGSGVDLVFAPAVEEIYPSYPQLTTIEVGKITQVLCGASRPGHFSGVATVVGKLFNIVQPDRAYFGQKDYQQVQVIKHMVKDLNMPLEIRTMPIVREEDGLAMSSRNLYLTATERREALCLYQALRIAQDLYKGGERSASPIRDAMMARIAQEHNIRLDYLDICDAETLEIITEIREATLIALAAKIGRTRLIDNIVLGGEETV